MDKLQLKQVLECLLFAANRPIPLSELVEIVGENQSEIEQALSEMKDDLAERKSALQISYVAEGVQFSTQESFHYWVKKLFKDQTTFKLSPSAMETLAIIAYKQPITRAEVDQIRGVESGGVIEKLFERRLVKIVGRKEALGRPMLYGTTLEFLRHFNLWKISDLPSLEELSLQLNAALDLPSEPVSAQPGLVQAESVPADTQAPEGEPAAQSAVQGDIQEPASAENTAESDLEKTESAAGAQNMESAQNAPSLENTESAQSTENSQNTESAESSAQDLEAQTEPS